MAQTSRVFPSRQCGSSRNYSKEVGETSCLVASLRCLYFYAAFYQFSYSAHHLPGVKNVAADALSRDNLLLFNSFVPQGRHTDVSQELKDLLISQQPNLGSRNGSRCSGLLCELTRPWHSPVLQVCSQMLHWVLSFVSYSVSIPPISSHPESFCGPHG